ncbi:ABC transporter substrate-binding protein [Mycetocola zhadangensis]|uniref:Extracellular solute-binding protein n=1 Tax=Mycetocola zhadangensis TaxID=1164595 RepID=A0A3L7IX17_9MICO|nr:extracellular solute-binding protein [Mycetocola zhadangensis]RLQ82700.1 extracellular solute-binding protein [Mycetocola zhadangensis]GGE98969.1 sugar ABC transporter substrate-binding protein [Mycetocola zhadangensis]
MQRRILHPALAFAAAALVLTGCAPGGTAGSAPASAEKPSTDLGSEEITLSLISTPESGASTKATIAAFEKEYPNVTVEYQQTNYDDYNKSVNLELNSDKAPDIALLNSVNNTVKNGLVLDLDPYAGLYDWTDKYPENQLNQWRVGENGTTLGDGPLYAAPAGFSEVGLYYNKRIAAELGITAPTTFAEFEEQLATAAAAGVLPLQLGNAEGHASFLVQSIGQSTDGAGAYADWAFGKSGSTFDTEGNRKGAEALADWAAKGWIPSDANGVNLQGAVDAFVSGKGLFLVDGNWDASKIAEGLGADAGFVPFPGDNVTAIGTSVAYAISSSTEHPNAAAAFLNFLGSPEASANQFEQGFMPLDPTAATPEEGTLQADLVSAWSKISEADGLVGFNNNASPTMNDTLTASSQELLAGRATPDEFLAAVQADWDETHGGN